MVKGRHFDGQNSRGAEVLVAPLAGGLRLEIQGEPPVFWAWSDLKPSSLTQTGKSVVITRGRATLELDASFLSVLKTEFPRASLFRSPFHTWIATTPRLLVTLALSVAALAGLFLVVVPWGGDWIASTLPPSLEREIGKSLRDQLLAHERVRTAETVKVQAFWNALNLPTQPTTVTVIDRGAEANAFALMGGQIIVYQGLLKLAQTPDELAGVLAHEAAHGELHHSARLIGRSLAGAFVLGYLLGDPSGITGAILGNGESLRTLQFSREMEAQADAWSVRALEGKTDTRALARLLVRLDKHPVPAWAQFLGDHPGTPERVGVLESTGHNAPASAELQRLFRELGR